MTITPITFTVHREGLLTADPEHAHLRIEHVRIAAEVLAAIYRARHEADIEKPAISIVTRA